MGKLLKDKMVSQLDPPEALIYKIERFKAFNISHSHSNRGKREDKSKDNLRSKRQNY